MLAGTGSTWKPLPPPPRDSLGRNYECDRAVRGLISPRLYVTHLLHLRIAPSMSMDIPNDSIRGQLTVVHPLSA